MHLLCYYKMADIKPHQTGKKQVRVFHDNQTFDLDITRVTSTFSGSRKSVDIVLECACTTNYNLLLNMLLFTIVCRSTRIHSELWNYRKDILNGWIEISALENIPVFAV